MDQTVFIVDDDLMVRDALALLVSSKGMRSAVFASAEDFLAVYDPAWRGCLLTDLQLPGMHGLELQAAIAAKTALPVVILTAHGDVASTRAALQAGALDFLEKPFDPEVLIDVLRSALRVDAERLEQDVARREVVQRVGRLTAREREVMTLLSQGRTYREIAERLHISIRTVEVYKSRLFAKLRCDSIAEVVRYALQGAAVDSADIVKKI